MVTNGQDSKPPYVVPTMDEVQGIPFSGYRAASTFSGCGGSSLGYRLAGFSVDWASEFIPAAAEVYKLNHSGHLDERDIRDVTPSDVLDVLGMQSGDLDLLDGSPPCAAFSTAGRREAGWDTIRKYSDTKQRVDDLFFEYARLVRGLQPKVFVAENVAGLVKGKAKGYFKWILKELKDCGYSVEAKVLDAQWLGVPQSRSRLIFQGIRNDLNVPHQWPKPFSYQYTLAEAIDLSDECVGRSLAPSAIKQWEFLKLGEQSSKYFNCIKAHPDRVCPCICQTHGGSGTASPLHPYQPRKFSIEELRRICSFPEDFKLTGKFEKQWERLGRAVPPLMMKQVALCARNILDAAKGK